MSQNAIQSVTGSDPSVPTIFPTDFGTAIPEANTLNIFGGVGTTTSASGNTIFVTLGGGGIAIDSISPDSGTDPVVPDAAGLVGLKGSGSITSVGSLNTLTYQLTGLTNHNVLVGAGTSTITKVPPSTAGFVLTSNGASSDPSFQTVSASGAITRINADTGFVFITPTAGVVTINGGTTGLR